MKQYTVTGMSCAACSAGIEKAVCAVADGNAVVETKRFRGTNVHNKIRNAIELGGNLYAVK